MAEHLGTAIHAIEAEIIKAKDGVNFYAARIASLEQVLAGLSQVSSGAAAETGKAKPREGKAKSNALKLQKPAKKSAGKVKSPGSQKQVAKLPFTGGDYWPNLITAEPKHASEVLQSAISQLGFAPTDKQIKMLQQRQTFALNALVKAGKIQDQGSGRGRVFFKK